MNWFLPFVGSFLNFPRRLLLLSKEELGQNIASPTTALFIAREAERNDAIVGALVLVLVRIPSGCHARIEDVVVDESARGKGVGKALMLAAMQFAKEAGARRIDLTSRPTRVAANELYRRLGFVQHKTNVYHYMLG
jgi:ribosomal protein S18 acetylase RimI-like enzyme